MSTTRRHISTTKRVDLFKRMGGVCHLCHGKVNAGEGWDVSHVIPLELGGADDESNWDVAHRTCHRAHTAAVDQPAIAQAKRREARHIGAHRSRTPMPCGRDSIWKRTMSGKVVRRDAPSGDSHE
jgi:5-methylcytosine-specific restriction protein A